MKKLVLILLLGVSVAAKTQDQSPYAGEQDRAIKHLSSAETEAYLAGSGMGYAKAAELNGYPGPKHVLELAEEMGLSTVQLQQTEQLYLSMNRAATDLGHLLVSRERALDEAFADESITASRLKSMLDEIARLEGEIRYIHLAAHLQQKALLSKHQKRQYMMLRGYGTGDAGHGQQEH